MMKSPGCLFGFFSIFAAAGLLCGVVGGFMVYSRFHTKSVGIKTTGKVIDLTYASKGDDTAPVVSYTNSKGREMVYHSDNFSNFSSLKIGDPVTIWYLPSDPESVVVDGEGWMGWFPFIFFFTHGGVGFGGLFWMIRKMRRMKWLKEQGTEIQARYTHSEGPTGKYSSYTLVCEWTDPLTQTNYTFKSDSLNKNPNDFIATNAKIRVLINPDNPDIYWVDTEFLGA